MIEAVRIPLPPPALAAERTRAHARARRHTRLVRALRRGIPFASGLAVLVYGALSLLSPLRGLDGALALGPISVSGTKVTMENPRLTGFRKGARPYEVTAAAALQDVRRPSIVELKGMKGQVAIDESGRLARLEALNGVFDTTKEALDLKDDIRLWTEAGQELRLRSAAVDFKAGTLRSREPVSVVLPEGTIDAAGLEVADSGKVVSFTGGVRAVFAADAGTRSKAAPTAPILTSSAEPEDLRR